MTEPVQSKEVELVTRETRIDNAKLAYSILLRNFEETNVQIKTASDRLLILFGATMAGFASMVKIGGVKEGGLSDFFLTFSIGFFICFLFAIIKGISPFASSQSLGGDCDAVWAKMVDMTSEEAMANAISDLISVKEKRDAASLVKWDAFRWAVWLSMAALTFATLAHISAIPVTK